jgi:hypothetical protein
MKLVAIVGLRSVACHFPSFYQFLDIPNGKVEWRAVEGRLHKPGTGCPSSEEDHTSGASDTGGRLKPVKLSFGGV